MNHCNNFRNTIRVSNSLDREKARHFVGPDLGPNCLQRLSADDSSRERVYSVSALIWACAFGMSNTVFSLDQNTGPPDKCGDLIVFFLFLNQNTCCGYSKELSQ